MRRRAFIALLGGATVAWPLAARAQYPAVGIAQSSPVVIGVLGSGTAQSSGLLLDAFKQGLRENNLAEGSDYILQVRWAEGAYARFPELAAELVGVHARIIVATTIAAVKAAQRAAPATPIVMTGIIDPVGAGLITSLAHPGGNTTGISNMAQDMTAKAVELLLTTVPTAKAMAALFNPANPGSREIVEDLQSRANTLGVVIRPVRFEGAATLDATLATATNERPDGLVVVSDATLFELRERIGALALRHGLPTVSSIVELTTAGALIGYGTPRRDRYRRAATYVKKILDGAKPADLPVEQPSVIELVINVRTAKALGIEIPPSLLARADEVIE
jgi:putative tryptophan/tyrosine transport system substrate-binding protein